MNKILANLRKHLDKNSIIGNDGYAVVQDHNALMEYIKANLIPLAIRENSDGTFCIIIVERMPTKKDEKNLQKFTKYFYILEDRIDDIDDAYDMIDFPLFSKIGDSVYMQGRYIKFK